MKTKITHLLGFCLALFYCNPTHAEIDQATETHPRLLKEHWTAKWIAHASGPSNDYAVYHFRKSFELRHGIPDSLKIHVSADQRYKLWINGHPIGMGPSRGDPAHWYYETYDIAPYLDAGKNVIAAQVWNAGTDAPIAQMGMRTAFILQANQPEFDDMLNTNASWKVYHNTAYQALPADLSRVHYGLSVGPGDKMDGRLFPWDWEQVTFDDSNWPNASVFRFAMPAGGKTGMDLYWMLTPRPIPAMQGTLRNFSSCRRADGIISPDNAFIEGQKTITIPAHTKASFLLDNAALTVGYPILETEGGENSKIQLTYAERLYDPARKDEDRNTVEGKFIVGLRDIFTTDGGSRSFTSTWIRTFRYVEVTIETDQNPLTVERLHYQFSAYPFEENATFQTDDPSLHAIWDVGWRTARLCAGETYMDCPYYEQLQYVGDTRIQALISLYVSGDDRLMKQAINLINYSRIPEGLTQSRYPSSKLQIIPPFSLFWIDMVHDYYMHRTDDTFLSDQKLGIVSVLHWYEQHMDPESGLIGDTPYWNFVDWAEPWEWSMDDLIGGIPNLDGGSSILTLQWVNTLMKSAELFDHYGDSDQANHCRALSEKLRQAVLKGCWNEERGLFSDTPAQLDFSQHANIWAILTDAVTGQEAVTLMQKILQDDSMIQATFYFKFYLFQAMYKVGLADQYLPQLDPWKQMLESGLTTFAEKPDPARSDCHAWSASPNYDFLATVCGIRPASPGFKTISIEPHLGQLKSVEASMPHPDGTIQVRFEKTNEALRANIVLPEGTYGCFKWKGSEHSLHAGSQILEL